MSTSSVQLPFLQRDGIARAYRHIAHSVRKRRDVAILLVHIRGLERLCAVAGHLKANELLDKFDKQLRHIARASDAVERLADRKFAVMLGGLRNRGHASLAANKIRRVLQETVEGESSAMSLTATIGVALCPEQGIDPQELMRSAEMASMHARAHESPLSFYETHVAEQLITEWSLEDRLARAIGSGRLALNFQPKFDLRTHQIVGAEALMRWDEPGLGPVAPDVFIELAETNGLIADLTEFAIQRTCRNLSAWLETHPGLNAAINITPSLIRNTEIVDVLRNGANIWNVPLESLTLEVTENALMADPHASHEVLTQVRAIGTRVSIDDFGTGYSSLAYLKEIPADELKIDRTFVMGMLEDEGDFKIVKHTIGIAKSFGLGVVAEGIESAEMLSTLTEMGCDYAQGYFLGKPMTAADFVSVLSGDANSATPH